MNDAELQKLMNDSAPHKLGEIIKISYFPDDELNKWEIIEILCGGYDVINCEDESTERVETKYVEHYSIERKEIENHKGHNIVKSFVINPKYDSFLYCRDCKEEVKSKYKVRGFDDRRSN